MNQAELLKLLQFSDIFSPFWKFKNCSLRNVLFIISVLGSYLFFLYLYMFILRAMKKKKANTSILSHFLDSTHCSSFCFALFIHPCKKKIPKKPTSNLFPPWKNCFFFFFKVSKATRNEAIHCVDFGMKVW